MNPFENRIKIDEALAHVRRVLDAEKHPQGAWLANKAPHEWEDKYLLAEWLTNTLFASITGSLSRIGDWKGPADVTLADWVRLDTERPMSLRFVAEERVTLNRTQKMKRNPETEVRTSETEVQTGGPLAEIFSTAKTKTTRVETFVEEWVWCVHVEYRTEAWRGAAATEDDSIQLASETGLSYEIVTTTGTKPGLELGTPDLVHDLTWLLTSGDAGLADKVDSI